MVELALKYGEGWQFLKEIAKKEEIFQKYLSQIVIALKEKDCWLQKEECMEGIPWLDIQKKLLLER
jgi:hypothetical protein